MRQCWSRSRWDKKEISKMLSLRAREPANRNADWRKAGELLNDTGAIYAIYHFTSGRWYAGQTIATIWKRAQGHWPWDVADAQASELGAKVGRLDFVSHCYLRPRALPDWPYNLFAMIHGQTRAEVEEKRLQIAGLLGEACRAHDILYSTRILKKTGLRLASAGD